MSKIEDEKYDPEHASIAEQAKDHADGVDRHLAITKPEILEGLSDEELAALHKSTTKKVDILLMPTLVALYILVCP